MTGMIQGKQKVLLFRELSKEATATAAKLVFQTGHTFNLSRSADKVTTKDGSLIKQGELESEVSIEAIQAKTDPVAAMLRDSVLNGTKLELWEVTIDEDLKVAEEYPAVYAQGVLDSWEWGAGVDDESSVSSTFHIELKPQFGMMKLTTEQEAAVQYAFRDGAIVVGG